MNRKFMSVKNCILEKIDKMSPNEKLPSERDLIEEFGFSRPTIQKALSDLENEGIIYRKPRQGSFVADRRLHKSLDSLQSFPEDLRSSGDIPSTSCVCAIKTVIQSFMITPTMLRLRLKMPAVRY